MNQSSTVAFHALSLRTSGDECVVGRPDTGQFVVLPAGAEVIIRALEGGEPLGAVEKRFAADGIELELPPFVEALREAGLVAAIDGVPVASQAPAQPRGFSLAWLRPRHVSWLFAPPVRWALGALMVGTAAVVVSRPQLWPSWRDWFWAGRPGVSALTQMVAFLVLGGLHELLHLAAARSYGCPSRISFSTRLVFLVLQTDVSSVWSLEKRQRYRVYLAGMAFDATVLCGSLLVLASDPTSPVVVGLARFLSLWMVLAITDQAHVYMRTDFYFVLLDALDCKNLFADAQAYLASWVSRNAGDPLAALPAHEARKVKVYAWVVLFGSALSLVIFFGYWAPIVVQGYVLGVQEIRSGDWWSVLDGVMAVVFNTAWYGMFAYAFVRTHPTWFRWGRRALAN